MTSAAQAAVDLQRPMSVAEVVGNAVWCYRRFPWLFAALGLAVVAPYALLVLALDGSTLLGARHASAVTQLTFNLVETLFVTPLISALHIHALAPIGEGRRPNLLEVARRGARVLPVVAAAELIATVGTFIGLLFLVVPGVILFLRWAVVAQVAAIERVNWRGALRRSAELTRDNYLHVLALFVVIDVLTFGITTAGGALAGNSTHLAEVLIAIALATITRSFAALTTALLFYDLLARKRQLRRESDPEYRIPRDYDQPS